jgi:predicted transcriptional regulator
MAVSLQLVKVYDFVRSNQWKTIMDIVGAVDVKRRTVESSAARLVTEGIFDYADLHGGRRYRLSPHPTEKALARMQQIEAAREIFLAVESKG